MAQALAQWLGGTMAQAQWRGHNGTGTMALAQAHWHRHDGTATGTRAIAGHNGAGMIQRAQWHRNNGIVTMAWATLVL